MLLGGDGLLIRSERAAEIYDFCLHACDQTRHRRRMVLAGQLSSRDGPLLLGDGRLLCRDSRLILRGGGRDGQLQ